MRPRRRRSKITPKQFLIYAVVVIGSLILLGILFWIFKPFSYIDSTAGTMYRYTVY